MWLFSLICLSSRTDKKETSSNLFNDTIFVYNKLFQMKKDMAIIYINEYHGKYFYEWTIHNHSPILMLADIWVFTKNRSGKPINQVPKLSKQIQATFHLSKQAVLAGFKKPRRKCLFTNTNFWCRIFLTHQATVIQKKVSSLALSEQQH